MFCYSLLLLCMFLMMPYSLVPFAHLYMLNGLGYLLSGPDPQQNVKIFKNHLASKWAKGIRDHQAHGPEAQNSLSSSPDPKKKNLVEKQVLLTPRTCGDLWVRDGVEECQVPQKCTHEVHLRALDKLVSFSCLHKVADEVKLATDQD